MFDKEMMEEVLRRPEGRALMADIIQLTGVYDLSHVVGSTEETAFREGRRSVGLKFMSIMFTMFPEYASMMVNEHFVSMERSIAKTVEDFEDE